jgi:hypothetical protein
MQKPLLPPCHRISRLLPAHPHAHTHLPQKSIRDVASHGLSKGGTTSSSASAMSTAAGPFMIKLTKLPRPSTVRAGDEEWRQAARRAARECCVQRRRCAPAGGTTQGVKIRSRTHCSSTA